MLGAKFFLTLCIVVSLTLVADRQVDAKPEPCGDLMRLMMMKPPTKPPPTSTPPPQKNPKKERLRQFAKFLDSLSPHWKVHIEEVERTTPPMAPATRSEIDNYMAFFSYLFRMF